jgi:hypothetical protein
MEQQLWQETRKAFKLKVQQIGPQWTFYIVLIHTEALASHDLEPKLHSVLKVEVKVVNPVKAHPLKFLIFAVLCEKMHADHKLILLHLEASWLSQGKLLND